MKAVDNEVVNFANTLAGAGGDGAGDLVLARRRRAESKPRESDAP
jgi:hypothetical protein